jgi:hypothetical protein
MTQNKGDRFFVEYLSKGDRSSVNTLQKGDRAIFVFD